MPKVHMCTLDQECFQKFQHYIKHWCLLIHEKQRNKPCCRSLVFFLGNILLVFHSFNMLIIILFCLHVHVNWSRSRILIHFSKSIALFKIVRIIFATLFGWLYFRLNNVLFPCVRLRYLPQRGAPQLCLPLNLQWTLDLLM
jgi:hypothetical protein